MADLGRWFVIWIYWKLISVSSFIILCIHFFFFFFWPSWPASYAFFIFHLTYIIFFFFWSSVSVFGVSAKSMQCSYDDRGNSVPTILLMMQRHLYSEGGLKACLCLYIGFNFYWYMLYKVKWFWSMLSLFHAGRRNIPNKCWE